MTYAKSAFRPINSDCFSHDKAISASIDHYDVSHIVQLCKHIHHFLALCLFHTQRIFTLLTIHTCHSSCNAKQICIKTIIFLPVHCFYCGFFNGKPCFIALHENSEPFHFFCIWYHCLTGKFPKKSGFPDNPSFLLRHTQKFLWMPHVHVCMACLETGERTVNDKIRTCCKCTGIPGQIYTNRFQFLRRSHSSSGAIPFHFSISGIRVGEFKVSSVPM